jgi:radical SAM/Cys-rich protein
MQFSIEPFSQFLKRKGLEITRAETTVLQINVGLLCNQVCRHCHLEAGPGRTESMSFETAGAVIDFAERCRFHTIDITGGAPEMNPNLGFMIERLASPETEIILRSNLTLLADSNYDDLMNLCRGHQVVITASFPSPNRNQTESQRGKDVFPRLIEALRKLNRLGYGQPGSPLKLNLVSNPAGAFLPVCQGQAEIKFRQDLVKNWGIVFTNLFTFSNVPLGRFRQWLESSGNYEGYMRKLVESFNPLTLQGLMCRTLVSISWDGYVYDCDFNQAANTFVGREKLPISRLTGPPRVGSPIAVGDHCFACTAGSGFT